MKVCENALTPPWVLVLQHALSLILYSLLILTSLSNYNYTYSMQWRSCSCDHPDLATEYVLQHRRPSRNDAATALYMAKWTFIQMEYYFSPVFFLTLICLWYDLVREGGKYTTLFCINRYNNNINNNYIKSDELINFFHW